MDRLTIDEAIEHCKQVARENREKADEEWRAFSIYPFGNAEESATIVDRCDECAEQHEQLVGWLEELKEYQELEEEGMLLKLPCKVGDTIYEIVNDEIISFSFKEQWRIARYLEAGIFGKIAFLTKEEAEQALKEMEGAE